jgi:hypothetical protein
MKLKANVYSYLALGEMVGREGEASPLGIACALPIPIAQNHHFRHGNIGRPTCRIGSSWASLCRFYSQLHDQLFEDVSLLTQVGPQAKFHVRQTGFSAC